jgi:hypothetical protein
MAAPRTAAIAEPLPAAGGAPTSPTDPRPALRLVPAPWPAWTEPTHPARDERAGPGNGQGTLDLEFVLPGGLSAVPLLVADLRAPAPRRCAAEMVEQAGPPTARAVLPPAGPWAARLAQAVLEVCTAGRPVAQLLRWTEPAIYQALEARYAPRAQRDLRRRRVNVTEQVRSVHVCEPADGVAEVSVVITGGERPRALALRLEGWRGRWVCTALDWI